MLDALCRCESRYWKPATFSQHGFQLGQLGFDISNVERSPPHGLRPFNPASHGRIRPLKPARQVGSSQVAFAHNFLEPGRERPVLHFAGPKRLSSICETSGLGGTLGAMPNPPPAGWLEPLGCVCDAPAGGGSMNGAWGAKPAGAAG